MLVPALLSAHLVRRQAEASPEEAANFLASPRAAKLLRSMAAGELIADKLPGIPDRIEPEGLIGRAGSGALAGWTLATLHGRSRPLSALIGGVAAMAGAHALYHARQWLSRTLPLPDLAVALAEDLFAIHAARRLLERALVGEQSRIATE